MKRDTRCAARCCLFHDPIESSQTLYTLEFHPHHPESNVKRLFSLMLVVFTALSMPYAQSASPSKQLTIEAIFADGGITGRAPETVKWSPDGTKVSFVQRDDSGEH